MREHHVDPGFALGTQFVPEGQRELADAVEIGRPCESVRARAGPEAGSTAAPRVQLRLF